MWLKSLHAENFRGFEKLDVTFDEHVTLLLGGNGAGKTAVLEAIAVGFGAFFAKIDQGPVKHIDADDARRVAYDLNGIPDVQEQWPVSIGMAIDPGMLPTMMSELVPSGRQVSWTRVREDRSGRTGRANEGHIRDTAERLQEHVRANVCVVHELDEVDGEPYLAMEYLRGVTWDHLIAAVPPGELALRATAAVTVQACAALHYAHTLRDATGAATPVVHRDVSPQNLFVTVDGVVKMLDFGIAKMDGGPRTRTGTVKGKQPYMAPEQIRGGAIDGRADVFALGACAWEALTGARLYDRPTDFAIWKAICDEPMPMPMRRSPRDPRRCVPHRPRCRPSASRGAARRW